MCFWFEDLGIPGPKQDEAGESQGQDQDQGQQDEEILETLADAQADLAALRSALVVLKTAWAARLPAAGAAAAAAVSRVGSAVLGAPLVLSFDPSLVAPWAPPPLSCPARAVPAAWGFWLAGALDAAFAAWWPRWAHTHSLCTGKDQDKKEDQDKKDNLDKKEDQAGRSQARDTEFVLACLRRVPRVRLGLAPGLAEICGEDTAPAAVRLGVVVPMRTVCETGDPTPPTGERQTRLVAAVVPRQASQGREFQRQSRTGEAENKQETKQEAKTGTKAKAKEKDNFTQAKQAKTKLTEPDPARGPAPLPGEIPPIVVDGDRLGLPSLAWPEEAADAYTVEDPDTPCWTGGPTRAVVADAIADLLRAMPAIPRISGVGPRSALAVLRTLAKSPISGAHDQDQDQTQGTAEFDRFAALWTRDLRGLPLPEVAPWTAPDFRFVAALRALADLVAEDTLTFPLDFYRQLVGVGAPQSESLDESLDPQLTQACLAAWPVLVAACAVSGFAAPPGAAFAEAMAKARGKAGKTPILGAERQDGSQDTSRERTTNPRRAHAAFAAWGAALGKATFGADQWVPCVLACLDFAVRACPALALALAWSADVGGTASSADEQTPDRMWCEFRGVPLKLRKLPRLPEWVDQTQAKAKAKEKDKGESE